MTPLAQPPSREASGPNSKFCQKNISLFSQNIEWIGLRHILETYDRGCLTVDELFLTARSGILLLPRAMNCDGNAVSISVPPSLEENQRRLSRCFRRSPSLSSHGRGGIQREDLLCRTGGRHFHLFVSEAGTTVMLRPAGNGEKHLDRQKKRAFPRTHPALTPPDAETSLFSGEHEIPSTLRSETPNGTHGILPRPKGAFRTCITYV